MKGLSTIITAILLIIITITTLSIVFLYYGTVVSKVTLEVEEIRLIGDCTQTANIEITNFDGENLTIRNNGGVDLDVNSFQIFSMAGKLNFSYSGSDIIKPQEEVVFRLVESPGPGVIEVIGECGVREGIDTRVINNCGDGICGFEENFTSCPQDC